MSFRFFLRGFLVTLVVFAIASYVLTQSLWTAAMHTLICAVLIQVGYFVAVLFMVAREKKPDYSGTEPAQAERIEQPAMDGVSAKKAASIDTLPHSKHS